MPPRDQGATDAPAAAPPRAYADARLDGEDAVERAQRLVQARPGDHEAWRALGGALLADGRVQEADDAFQRALELRPGDVGTLIDVGHTAYARGRAEEALDHLELAAQLVPDDSDVLRSLMAMQRRLGRPGEALDAAQALVERRPDDLTATLDLVELTLAEGRLDDAARACRRLRALDAEPGHEVYPCHALVAVELRRGEWRRALDHAIAAARVDRDGRTTDLIAYTAAQVFGPRGRPVPSADEVDELLATSLAEHRALHVEPLALS
jgi:tetratricopeptide (TPR) repeat protein